MTDKIPVTEEDVAKRIKELKKKPGISGGEIGILSIVLGAIILVASIGGSFGSDGFMSGVAVSLMAFGLYALTSL